MDLSYISNADDPFQEEEVACLSDISYRGHLNLYRISSQRYNAIYASRYDYDATDGRIHA